MAQRLTDRAIAALRPAPAGKRTVVADAVVPGLQVRVTDTGHKSFLLGARYPGSKDYKRRELGRVGVISLSEARELARKWLALIADGIDPRQQAQAARHDDNTFGAIAEAFITRRLGTQRRAARVANEIRKELLPAWGTRPIATITRRDIRELIQQIVDRPARAYAFNIYDDIRAVFNYALSQDIIENAPTSNLKPRELIGLKRIRERVLTDDEIRKLWAAATDLGYPHGKLTQLLLLTGARLNELARASWSEVDLKQATITIPAARFKMNATHVIPLSDDAVELLKSLPRWGGGDYIFSAQSGRQPAYFSTWAKNRLNAGMGDAPAWCMHDLRRTYRTRLSELRIEDRVCELAIGHARRGLQRLYDRHEFADEIRAAMESWAARLRSIIEPPSPGRSTVVGFRRRG